ncbi:hypothetical protein [Actinomadura chokoriensis]|uniref:hypothetical protein n=1 Tax=Actinomadura chokoriensis TaxID=454156 RepID=UPI0031F78A3D
MSRQYQQPPGALPPPGLLSAQIPNLGPVIDPPYSDVPDFSEYLAPAETKAVEVEPLESWFTTDIRQKAVDLALESDRVTRKLEGKRHQVLDVGTRSMDRETELPLVGIYNYTDDVVVEVTIDPMRRAVIEVAEKSYQPALTESEQKQAVEIVRDDGRLAAAGIDVSTGVGLIVEDEDAGSPRHGHRLVDLRFGPADRYVPTAFAIVDLSAQEIAEAGLIAQEVAP